MLEPNIMECATLDDESYTLEDMQATLENENNYVLMPNKFTVIFLYKLIGDVAHVHINVTKVGRGEMALKAAQDAIEWIKENTEFKYLNAHIPSRYPNVKAFAEKVGFRTEFTIPKACKKDGKTYDIHVLLKEL